MKRILILSLCGLSLSASAQQKLDVEAHRGGRGIMPENTIAAMIHAIDLGVKTLELDCVISKDKQVVVSHDVYMSSDFMLKPNGSEISKDEQQKLLLYTMTYDSIKRFDAGIKAHAQFPQQKKMKTYRPLLAELIDSVEAYVKLKHLKPVYYNMEIKSTPAEDNNAHPAPDEFVDLVENVLLKKKITDRVIIQSFDTRPLVILHKKYPKQTLSYLTANKDGFDDTVKKLGFTPHTVSPYYTMITDKYVNDAHKNNVKVLPWTVNDEASMKKMEELQVDGIISDYPDKLVALFGSYQKK